MLETMVIKCERSYYDALTLGHCGYYDTTTIPFLDDILKYMYYIALYILKKPITNRQSCWVIH